MIWVDLLLVTLGLALATVLHRRGSPHTRTAVVGTLLGIAATISGFSIGVYITPLAAIALILALRGLWSDDRVT